MGTAAEPRPLRRLAASASLGITAAVFAVIGLQEHFFSFERWGFLGVAALTGVAAVGLARRSVMTQVLSRGMAWVALLPTAAGTVASLMDGRRPDLSAVVLAASSGAALLLGRHALHTAEAKREFSPVAYRRWFLAGSVSAVTAGLVAALGAAGDFLWGSARSGLGFTALAAVLLMTAVGVVRMRAWGVLLGAATSVVMLGCAMMLSSSEISAMACALAALPGLLLAAPLVAARLRPEGEVLPATAPPPIRLRVQEQPILSAASVVEAEPEWEASGGARHSRS